MSQTTAISGRVPSEKLVRHRRARIKAFLGGLILLPLLIAGHQGKQLANIQASVREAVRAADEVQQRLNEQTAAAPLEAQGADPPRDLQFRTSLENLRMRLQQLSTNFSPEEILPFETVGLRAARATLANAEQRFSDSLSILAYGNGTADSGADPEDRIRLLQARGAAFYGLRQWPRALETYQQLLALKPNEFEALTRAAHCYLSLGRVNEAVRTFKILAAALTQRGHDLIVLSRFGSALPYYERAMAIHTYLVEKQERTEFTSALASSHLNLANAHLLQENPAALAHYQQAIEIQTRLYEKGARADLALSLASIHAASGDALLSQGQPSNAAIHYQKAIDLFAPFVEPDQQAQLAAVHGALASALMAQGQFDSALLQYEKSMALLSPLVQDGAPAETACALALAYNNRGAVRRTRGQLAPALRDFETAIAILSEARARPISGSKDPPLRIQLDVALGHSGKSMEMLTRTRLAARHPQRHSAVALAMAFRNCGYAHISEGKAGAAISDLRQAMELHRRLVQEEGQSDLVLQFARSLSAYALSLAAAPEDSLRDGSKAKEYALQACQLTDWKSPLPMEALAAACAEISDFAQAIAWQQKAIDLAPASQHQELLPVLQLYQEQKPYRLRLPAA